VMDPVLLTRAANQRSDPVSPPGMDVLCPELSPCPSVAILVSMWRSTRESSTSVRLTRTAKPPFRPSLNPSFPRFSVPSCRSVSVRLMRWTREAFLEC
jgi:hypothetical protein